MVNLFESKKDCCGCGACVEICSQKAISMKEDEYGFIYPYINYDKCVNCKLCLSVCNYKKNNYNQSLMETYAGVATNTNVLESTSGGIFSNIAKNVLNAGGYVCGASIDKTDEQFEIYHKIINSNEDLIKLKGSKYVQSCCNQTFKKIKDLLLNNQVVLFCGTPCQVDGLYGYLRKNYKNLYTIDLICHGVPSAKLFNDYIKNYENKTKKKVLDFKFRDKHAGWKLYGKMVLKDLKNDIDTYYFEPEESSYYQMFLNSETYRENCYSCKYASCRRPGNITIGDFWNIDLVHPDYLVENGGLLDENKGISTIMINDSKGKELLELYGKDIILKESSYDNASKYNKQLRQPSVLTPKRDKALNILKNKGYSSLEKWYQKRLLVVKIKRFIISLIPKPIKKFRRLLLNKIL